MDDFGSITWFTEKESEVLNVSVALSQQHGSFPQHINPAADVDITAVTSLSPPW